MQQKLDILANDGGEGCEHDSNIFQLRMILDAFEGSSYCPSQRGTLDGSNGKQQHLIYKGRKI